MDTYICMPESLYGSPETITILLVDWLYPNIKKKKKLKKKVCGRERLGLGQIGSKWIFSNQDIFDCFNIFFFHVLMTIPIVLKLQRRKPVTTNQNNGTFF